MTHTDPRTDVDTGLAAWLAEHRDGPAARTALSGGLALPTAADVLGTIDCGLLAYPYLEVYQDGAKLPAAEVFTARRVQNHKVTGFVHHRNVTGQYRAGATLRLPSVADWLAAARPAPRPSARCSAGTSSRPPTSRRPDPRWRTARRPWTPSSSCAPAASPGTSARRTPSRWRSAARTAVYVPAGTARGVVVGDDGDCLLLVLAERSPTTTEFVKALRQAGAAHLEQQEPTGATT